jgi:hypothetical protein
MISESVSSNFEAALILSICLCTWGMRVNLSVQPGACTVSIAATIGTGFIPCNHRMLQMCTYNPFHSPLHMGHACTPPPVQAGACALSRDRRMLPSFAHIILSIYLCAWGLPYDPSVITIIRNILMPVQWNSLTHPRVLLVLTDRSIYSCRFIPGACTSSSAATPA